MSLEMLGDLGVALGILAAWAIAEACGRPSELIGRQGGMRGAAWLRRRARAVRNRLRRG